MSDPVRRFYVLRHGEVAYFDANGRPADPWQAGLTERGRRQIDDLAALLTGCGVDRLVTSTVPRALESARIIADRLSLAPVHDEAWNELEPGDLSDVAEADLRRVIVDAYHAGTEPGSRFFGGETFTAFAERVDIGVRDLLDDDSWTTAVVVTHDPVARYLVSKALGLGLAGLRFFEQDVGCLNIIDWMGQGGDQPSPIVRLVNGTADNLVKTGSREPALARFYESYRASRAGSAS